MQAWQLVVVPVGRLDPTELAGALARATKVLRRPVELRTALAVPPGVEDADRGQFRAAVLMERLAAGVGRLGAGQLVGAEEGAAAAPTPGRRPDAVLFVTDVDLYTANTAGAIAALQSAKGLAVISVRRLREAFYRRPADPGRQRARLVKEILRMAGRLQGAAECTDPHCVMAATHVVADLDIKEERYCRACAQRLFEGRVQL
ncbi:MAG TPA: hypothetical protein VJS92_13230 [Candidatus Polarisedimenticolaceae bacterium]|nr:hypothetical protein [Candidatus Polarisedimenticolaceae bacterium]